MSNKRKNILVCATDGRTCQTLYKLVPCLNDDEVEFYKEILEKIKQLPSNYDCGFYQLEKLFDSFINIVPKSILKDYANSKIHSSTNFDFLVDFIYPFFDDLVGVDRGARFNKIVKYNVVTMDILE